MRWYLMALTILVAQLAPPAAARDKIPIRFLQDVFVCNTFDAAQAHAQIAAEGWKHPLKNIEKLASKKREPVDTVPFCEKQDDFAAALVDIKQVELTLQPSGHTLVVAILFARSVHSRTGLYIVLTKALPGFAM